MRNRHRPALVRLAVALLAVEFLLVAAGGVLLLVSLLVSRPASYASAVVLVVLAFVAALGVALMVGGMLRGRAWVRAAGIVWQLLQLAVGISALTGQGAQPWLGWPLIVVAVVLLVLLFTPTVMAATAQRGADE